MRVQGAVVSAEQWSSGKKSGYNVSIEGLLCGLSRDLELPQRGQEIKAIVLVNWYERPDGKRRPSYEIKAWTYVEPDLVRTNSVPVRTRAVRPVVEDDAGQD